MPEPLNKYQSLTSRLYIEDIGTIDIDCQMYKDRTYSKVKIWSIPGQKYIWEGTPEEFWDLILAGIETKRLMSPCPKCNGTNRDHAPDCPLIALAKKEDPECSQS